MRMSQIFACEEENESKQNWKNVVKMQRPSRGKKYLAGRFGLVAVEAERQGKSQTGTKHEKNWVKTGKKNSKMKKKTFFSIFG